MKGTFTKYDKNCSFGILTDPFLRAKLPSTTRFLQYVLDPSIKNINDSSYQYYSCHCVNGVPQVKGTNFDQFSSLVLASPTLCLIATIAVTYHLTIGIEDITNDFHNNLKASYESEIINCPPITYLGSSSASSSST